MTTRSEQPTVTRSKAEELQIRRDKAEAERLANRAKESRAVDEKIARLRALRLAKEAADLEAAQQVAAAPAGSRKKKTAG